jgi:hypothetical protein
MIETKSCIPSDILQSYDKKLLSYPAVKFYDDSARLWSWYQWIKRKLQRKTVKDSIRNRKFLELEKQFLELYERTVAKEKDIEKKTGEQAVRAFRYFEYPLKNDRKIFERFRRRAY